MFRRQLKRNEENIVKVDIEKISDDTIKNHKEQIMSTLEIV